MMDSGTGSTAPYVLVIEDDDEIRESFEELLRLDGHKVTAVRNGLEGLALLARSAAPRLILLDLMMPEMTGVEFLARLQENPQLKQIPIVAVTASRQQQPPPGAVALLSKPFEMTDLWRIVRQYVR